MPCADNPRYISVLGLGCAQHTRLVCTNLRSVGLSTYQVEEILLNCPASCSVSACDEDDKSNGSFYSIARNIQDGDSHTKSTGTKRTTHVRSIKNISRNLNEFGACFPGWDPSCRDDSSYLSPIGLGCTGFQAMGCDVFSKVGFTDEEVEELKSRCPCSCQQTCPSPTALPSSTPSTASPTLVPTLSPSWLPTSSPTATLTKQPIPYPTRPPTRNPTPRPTDGPTGKPTTFPTLRPTKVPSHNPSTIPSTIPTNEPTVSQRPSVSFAPTPSPTTSSQLNRLPNKPIRASNGSVDGTPIDQGNGTDMDFSIHQLVIICVSFCAFVAFGIALFVSVKRNSRRMKEYREKRKNIRRKRLQATKKEVRRKLSTFKKNRRGVFASTEEYSTNNKRKNKKETYTSNVGSRQKRNLSQSRREFRGLAVPTRKQNVQGPSPYRLSHRQESFDTSVSSHTRHMQSKSRRGTHSRGRKQKETNVYKGAEFLKPVSRGGKEDLCMVVVERVDSAINEKGTREYQVESQSVSSRSSRWTSATRSRDESIGKEGRNRRGVIPPFKGRLRPSRSGDQDAYTSAENSHRATDLTLSGDDRTQINQKGRGMLGELADDVADAVDDLKLIFK